MITWNTETNLGTITANASVNIILIATSTISTNEKIFYTLIDGKLPSGLTLNLDGIISGRALQENEQLIVENSSQLVKFTVKAQGITSLEYSEKEFEITVNLISYKNIIAKAFLNTDQRTKWDQFINNESIFIPKYIYNFENNQYGVNKGLEMLLFAGIEEELAIKYISAIGLNHKRKQFCFGEIEIAQAIPTGQREAEYEAIYVKIYDPLDIDKKVLPNRIKNYPNQQEYLTADHNEHTFWTRNAKELATPMPIFERTRPNIGADATGYFASDPNPTVYFPSSISNWRNQILTWKDDLGNKFFIERNYLPLWMRTIQFQNNQYQELGYIPAVVLCYCIPGTANKILTNIQNHMNDTDFNFNQLQFFVDRFIIGNYFFFRRDSNSL